MNRPLYRDSLYRSFYAVVDDYGNVQFVFLKATDSFLRTQWEFADSFVGGLGV